MFFVDFVVFGDVDDYEFLCVVEVFQCQYDVFEGVCCGEFVVEDVVGMCDECFDCGCVWGVEDYG